MKGEGHSLDEKLTPYTSNIEYLSDLIDWLSTKIRVTNLVREREDDLDRMFLPIYFLHCGDCRISCAVVLNPYK